MGKVGEKRVQIDMAIGKSKIAHSIIDSHLLINLLENWEYIPKQAIEDLLEANRKKY